MTSDRRPDFRPDPLQPSLFFEEACSPVEFGWLRVGHRCWEKPNGETYYFRQDQPEVIYRPVDEPVEEDV